MSLGPISSWRKVSRWWRTDTSMSFLRATGTTPHNTLLWQHNLVLVSLSCVVIEAVYCWLMYPISPVLCYHGDDVLLIDLSLLSCQNLWGLPSREFGGVSGRERGERLSDSSLWAHDHQVSILTTKVVMNESLMGLLGWSDASLGLVAFSIFLLKGRMTAGQWYLMCRCWNILQVSVVDDWEDVWGLCSHRAVRVFSCRYVYAERQHTWRSSPSRCLEYVLVSSPTPTITSPLGTHTSVLWASRPWVSLSPS